MPHISAAAAPKSKLAFRNKYFFLHSCLDLTFIYSCVILAQVGTPNYFFWQPMYLSRGRWAFTKHKCNLCQFSWKIQFNSMQQGCCSAASYYLIIASFFHYKSYSSVAIWMEGFFTFEIRIWAWVQLDLVSSQHGILLQWESFSYREKKHWSYVFTCVQFYCWPPIDMSGN